MGKFAELTDCELATMKCVWDAKENITVPEIVEKLKENYGLDYKPTTVYTFVKKLYDKGFVDYFKRGVKFYYPKRTQAEYIQSELNRTCEFWFDGSKTELVSALLKGESMSTEEKKDIQQLIDSLDE